MRTSDGVAFDWAAVSATVAVNNSFSVVTARVQDFSAAGNKLNVYLVGEGLPATMPPVATFYTQYGDNNYTLFAAKGRSSFVGPVAALRLEKAVEARFTQGRLTIVSFASDAPFPPPPPRPLPGAWRFWATQLYQGTWYCALTDWESTWASPMACGRTT